MRNKFRVIQGGRKDYMDDPDAWDAIPTKSKSNEPVDINRYRVEKKIRSATMIITSFLLGIVVGYVIYEIKLSRSEQGEVPVQSQPSIAKPLSLYSIPEQK